MATTYSFVRVGMVSVLLGGLTAGIGVAQGPSTRAKLMAPTELLLPTPPAPIPSTAINEQPPANALTLAQALELAAAYNPELAAARARADSARGRLIQAGLYINPQFLWDAGAMSLTRGPSGGEQGPLIVQQIVTANKIKLSEGAAAHGVDAADWAAVTKQFDVVTRVRIAYFEVVTAEAEVKANEAVAKLAQLGLDAAHKLEKAGAGVRPDILLAQAELGQSRLRLGIARQRLDTGWKLLASTVGVPRFPATSLAFSLDAAAPRYEWEPVLTTVLSRSAEVQEAQAYIRQADVLIHRAEAEVVPNLLLGVRPYWVDVTQAVRLGVQIGFNIPVFNRNQGEIHSAQANLMGAREAARLVEFKLQERLATAFLRYQAAKEAVDAYDTSILRDAEESLRLVRLGYERGDAKYNYAVVLQAQRTVAQAELARVQALGELWKASAEIAGLLQE